MRARTAACILAAAIGAVASAGGALAQPAAEFFRNQKTITVVVSSTVGGGYDGYARMFGRYMSRYLPGNPTFVINNMPGAGGVRAANYIFNVAPRDGSVIGTVDRGMPTAPLFYGADSATRFDGTKFNWIGSAQRDVGLGVATNASPAKTIDEIRKTEIVVGANGPESDAALFPHLLNDYAGTRFKVVNGYPGLTEVVLAMERGEVNGMFMSGWGGPTTDNAVEMHKTKRGRIFVQLATIPKPEMADAPLILDVIPKDDDRQVVAAILSRLDLGRPFLAPPGVPPDRVAMLRDAFAKAAVDPELVAEANKTKLYVNAITGEDAQAMIEKVYATPQPVVERVRQVFSANKQ